MLEYRYWVAVLRKSCKMVQNDINFRMILRSILSVPPYRGILGQVFFSVIKKNWWHRWHTPILAYYCWYRPIIVCQGPWHTVAQSNKLYLPTTFSECTRRARPFLFFRKLFCPKISLYSITLI